MDVLRCLDCRLCKGSHFMWPPVLFTGKFDAPVLVIGQNPGVFPESDWRMTAGVKLEKISMSLDSLLETFNINRLEDRVISDYHEDFGESFGAKMLGKVFGSDWMDGDDFCFTNAVRCRTPENATPSEEMQHNCYMWTLKLLDMPRKAIVLVGAVARNQVLSGKMDNRLSWGVIRTLQPSGTKVMAIKHWSAWKHDALGLKVADVYRSRFEEMMSE